MSCSVQSKRRMMDRIRSELKTLSSTINRSRVVIKAREEKVEELLSAQRSSRAALDDLARQFDAIDTPGALAPSTRQELSETTHNREAAQREVQGVQSDMTDCVRQLTERLSRRCQEVQEKECRVRRLTVEIQSLKSDATQQQAERSAIEKECRVLQKSSTTLEANIEGKRKNAVAYDKRGTMIKAAVARLRHQLEGGEQAKRSVEMLAERMEAGEAYVNLDPKAFGPNSAGEFMHIEAT